MRSAEAGRLPHVVGDEQDRRAGLPPDPLQLVVHDVAGHGVQRAEGLVHEQHVGLLGQRPGQGDPLAHAARELVGLLVDEAVQAHQLEELDDPWSCAASRGTPRRRSGKLDVLAHGQPREQRRLLEHEGGLAAEDDLAGRRLVEAGHQVEQGGLAATRRSDQADELAGLDLERDPIEGEDGVVPAPEALGDGVQGRPAAPRPRSDWGWRWKPSGLEDGRGHSSATSGWPAAARTSLRRVRS